MQIAAVEVRRYRSMWGTPVNVSWDPTPRTLQEATVVLVTADDGTVGIASGDDLPDAALLERHLRGVDPRRGDLIHAICATVDFHGGRPWIVELACLDLAARAAGEPLWRYLGGRNDHLLAYASTCEIVDPDERIERTAHMRMAGFRAVKLRLPLTEWTATAAAVDGVRQVVGDELELMVDANQGWRMAGDVRPQWDVAEAVRCAHALQGLGVYWLEEPLPTANVRGYAELRAKTSLRIAAGELVRTAHEARDLVLHGGVDVLQCDIALSGGFTGARRLAALAELNGGWWTPHTWSNGLGMLANLHAAMAWSQCPYVEIPFDPPVWSPDRRDWLLPEPVFCAEDGTVRPPEGPGLGVPTDLSWIESNRLD